MTTRHSESDPRVAARVAANLVRLREAAGFDRAGLGARAELDEGSIESLGRGREPSSEDLTRLAGALGVDPGDFFRGGRWTPPADGGNGFEVEDE